MSAALLSIFLNAAAQLTLKSLSSQQIKSLFQILNFWQFYATGFLYLSSIAAWYLALRNLQLSSTYPLQALGYVIVSISAWIIFNEKLNTIQIVSLSLIVAGVILLAVNGTNK